MKQPLIIALFTGLIAIDPAVAQVYKCDDGTGRMVYQQSPCTPESEPMELRYGQATRDRLDTSEIAAEFAADREAYQADLVDKRTERLERRNRQRELNASERQATAAESQAAAEWYRAARGR